MKRTGFLHWLSAAVIELLAAGGLFYLAVQPGERACQSRTSRAVQTGGSPSFSLQKAADQNRNLLPPAGFKGTW